ncbi:hypothetical protein ACN38_g11713 [Penicillium nordicum]|uniref:Uncharacterized protein n=1 Tax=Penicillium nordicum TaxID=229535 RepID=A0A0M8NZF9_9EURO|nr:hypothetical protein ACN38_g11713 [Penicillium nordicum]
MTTLGTGPASSDISCFSSSSLLSLGPSDEVLFIDQPLSTSTIDSPQFRHTLDHRFSVGNIGNLREFEPLLGASPKLRGNLTFNCIYPRLNQEIDDNGSLWLLRLDVEDDDLEHSSTIL